MQLTLNLADFNIFIMMYIKTIIHGEVDHKAGLRQKVEQSGVPEADILFKEREIEIENGRWNTDKDRDFNDKLKEMIPDLDLKGVNEFDWFLDIIDARNIDNWLIQHYFRQRPEIRLYIKRFINQINNNDDIKVKLII